MNKHTLNVPYPKRKRESAIAGAITVLRTADNDKLATKRFTYNTALSRWTKIAYDGLTWFTASEHAVSGLTELAALLERLRRDPRAFVVRGALLPEAHRAIAANPLHRIRRRTRNGATLIEAPQPWIMLDVDDYRLRASDDLAGDPESVVDRAIHDLLPPAFHDAECFWQLSASAGFEAGVLKAHLWFWLSEPASSEHVKAVLKQHAPRVDRSPFSAAQPHYVADPVIAGGYDPLPRRTGWRKGLDDAVTLPALRPFKKRPAGAARTGTWGIPGVEAAVARIGDGAELGGFHEPIRGAILAYAGTGARDDAEFKDWLRAAIRAAPNANHPDVETPYCQDSYLQSSIDGARRLFATPAPMPPHHPAPAGTLADAQAETARHAGSFFTEAAYYGALDDQDRETAQGDCDALRIGAGVGKTFAATEEARRFVANTKSRVLWLVPDHRLAAEACDTLRRLGLASEVWRGRTDDVKNGPATCQNMQEVREAAAYGQIVEASVCGPKNPDEGARCPFYAECLFQRQKLAIAGAQVVVAAHQSLWFPQEVGSFGAVVIDEAFWQSGILKECDDAGRERFPEIDIASFAREVELQPVLRRPKTGQRQKEDMQATAELTELASKVEAAFKATPAGGFLTRQALLDAGVEVLSVDLAAHGVAFKDAHAVRKAIGREWKRMVRGGLYPGLTAEERRQAFQRAAGNRDIPARMALWRAIRDLLEGNDDATGRIEVGVRTVTVRAAREVVPKLARLPTLILDATLPLDIVRVFFPHVRLRADINPDAPHLRLTQVVGGFGKTTLEARPDRVAELVDLARDAGAAVVTFKDIEPAFADAGLMTGHYGAIVGQNRFKDARHLFVAGVPLPEPGATRDMALALFGRPIPAGTQPHKETRGALMRDRTAAAVVQRAYADPGMEAVRAAVVEASAVQAIARARGVRRTAADPVDVVLFANVCLPLPIDRLVRWEEVQPSVVQRMACRGVVLISPRDAARCYPDLFPTEKAAEHALARDPQSPNAVIEPITGMGDCEMVQVRYQHPGARQKWRTAHVRADLVAGFADWLGVPGVRVETVEATPAPPEALAMPDFDPAKLYGPARVDTLVDVLRVRGARIERSGFQGAPPPASFEVPPDASPRLRAIIESMAVPPARPAAMAAEIAATLGRMPWGAAA